jgi:lipopolysaccharide transport system ATP-binding protein
MIKVSGLGKQYEIGADTTSSPTLYESVSGILRSPIRSLRALASPRADSNRFWALREVDFEIAPGEVLGVVGRNGAGKNTLLKIISRITAPTEGTIEYRGRLASLLEVGTGFHPELTGRENIKLNAAILGMRSKELASKFDDIVEFSGVSRFLDTPVKRYSSGMYVRLAFSVAAHVDADVLLIDEVLAVGDAEFQKRCLGKMEQVAHKGRTVIFVSHNLTALRNLCTTGLLLDGGRGAAMGSIDDVLNSYSTQRGDSVGNAIDLPPTPESNVAAIRRVEVVPAGGVAGGDISVSSGLEVRVLVDIREDNVEIGAFLHCHDDSQNRVFSSGSFFVPKLNGLRLGRGVHEFICPVPRRLLNAGEYSLDVSLVRDRKDVVAEENSLIWFRVHDEPLGVEGWHWAPIGTIRPELAWRHTEASP